MVSLFYFYFFWFDNKVLDIVNFLLISNLLLRMLSSIPLYFLLLFGFCDVNFFVVL